LSEFREWTSQFLVETIRCLRKNTVPESMSSFCYMCSFTFNTSKKEGKKTVGKYWVKDWLLKRQTLGDINKNKQMLLSIYYLALAFALK
jgi:hypothetical protein